MQESTRPTNKKVKRGGQYCVAGLPNGESCTNSSLTPGISMHRFPSKNLDLRRQWIRFVRRHRANFNHQAYSIGPYLCSDHFERSCYEKPFALELPGFDSSKTKRTLKKDGIPTVFDTRGRSQAFSESSSKVARNRRTLLRGIKQHEHANKNECASGQFDEEIEEVEVGENAFTIGEQHNDSEEHVDVVPLQCQVHLTGAPVHTCPTCITPQREEVQGNIRTHTAIQVAMMCKKCTETRKKIQNLRRQNNRLKHVIRTLREGSEKNEDSGNPIPVEDILHAEESNENLSEDEDSEWKVDEADSSPSDMSDSDGTDFDDYDYDDTHKKRQQVRHIMAVSHFNENLHREAQKDKNGKEYFKVSYPKYKLGEEAVKPVPVPPSYNYVEHTKELLFKSNEEELGQIWKKYADKMPASLNISSKQRDLKQDFEFKSISMQESTRPTNKKVKRGGQYCVAGLPNGESCTNSSLTPGISMHRFPSKNLDLRRQWIRFVRRHRANFNHQAYSIGPYLCSDHFERSCYEKPFALELPGFDSSKTKRTLKKDGIPTVFDTRGRSQAFSESSSKVARNRRTLLRGIKQHEHANKNECASGQFDEEIEEVEVGENAFTIGEQHNDSEEHVDVVPLQCQVHLTGAPVHTCPTCITPQREEVQGNIRTHTAIQVAMMCKKCTETRKKIQNLRRQNNRLKHVIRTLREGSEKNEDSGNPIPVEDILHAEESNENLSEDEDSEWKVDEADSSPSDMSDSDGTDFDDYDYDDTHKKRQQVSYSNLRTPSKPSDERKNNPSTPSQETTPPSKTSSAGPLG
eukprot:gene7530-13311_t